MGEKTGISWTDHTINLWWGCTKIAAGCDNCYAAVLSKRSGRELWGNDAPRLQILGATSNLDTWNRRAEKRKQVESVFCGSMMDIFELHHEMVRPDGLKPLLGTGGERNDFFRSVATGRWRNLVFQFLTKRPQNIRKLIDSDHFDMLFRQWFGTSIAMQADMNRNALALYENTPRTAKRFLSVEPILEAIDVRPALKRGLVDWVIVGGESGSRARPVRLDWIDDVIYQCGRYDTPVFVKQLGTVWAKQVGAKDGHGADPEEWPKDLRRQDKMPI